MDRLTDKKIVIILGSASDKGLVESSGMLRVFRDCGVQFEVSVCSAHRNPQALVEYCDRTLDSTAVYIAIAGMAAALPGAIFANTAGLRPVIGVALPSSDMLGATDALYSMVRMPPGCPVLTAGIGVPGLKNAAIAACQILSNTHPDIMGKLGEYLEAESAKKPVELAYETSEGSE